MTGRLQVCEPQAEVAKHTHAILKLASGWELRFVDPRRFGRMSVAASAGFDATGVEPLEIEIENFAALFPARKPCLKSLARPARGHSQVNITRKPRHLIAVIVVGPCLNRLSATKDGRISISTIRTDCACLNRRPL
jgi:hypothetical protein